jgi:hypothetical protein
MAHRRSLLAIVLLAVTLHSVAIARTLLPSQDGLKLIRFARQFQTQPLSEAIRGADVHPLYPALIAIVEPLVARFVGEGPEAWRLAAQCVAMLASVGLLVPVYFLTERLFGRRIAFVAAGIAALLPRLADVGHETLGDSVGLFSTAMTLWLAARALTDGDRRDAVGAALFAALGYLARPEVILVPAAVGLTWLIGLVLPAGRWRSRHLMATSIMLAIPAMAVAGYASIKGEISEKLSLRWAAGLGPQNIVRRPVPQQVPSGLDNPRLDFSAKEESDHVAIRGAGQALRRIFGRWWEAMVWYFAVMAAWGFARRSAARRMLSPDDRVRIPGVNGLLLGVFIAVYTIGLLRHSSSLGYLSGRHVLPLVVASIPWAAAGAYVSWRRLGELMHLSPQAMSLGRAVPIGLALVLCVGAQLNPRHDRQFSRWSHWAAGRWLAAHAIPGEEVLDTRGWARFISGLPGYDYWHVRQALTDSKLSYIVVGLDEWTASSARAETLRTILAYAGTPLADFPASPLDPTPSVRIYRFRRPASWEGIAR